MIPRASHKLEQCCKDWLLRGNQASYGVDAIESTAMRMLLVVNDAVEN